MAWDVLWNQIPVVVIMIAVMFGTLYWAIKTGPSVLSFAGVLAMEVVFGVVIAAIYNLITTGRL